METLVEFYLDNELFAARTLSVILPLVGDEVRFKGICYEVVRRVFLYDESIPMVALDIRHLTPAAPDSATHYACGIPVDDCIIHARMCPED